jgi:DNA-directed RNA polymerase specialized sigma24 family protein
MADEEDRKENENFEALLRWLDPDWNEAWKKYEHIRERLIKIFTLQRFEDVEGLADEVMDRVEKKITEIVENYSGDPEPYFYGVARNVGREQIRKRKKFSQFDEESGGIYTLEILEENSDSTADDALKNCLKQLSEKDRELILEYYQYEQKSKKTYHLKLAANWGMSRNALWIRVSRIRTSLKKCFEERRRQGNPT